MPFRYYGSKKKLAPKYPAPRHQRIIEPFAGAGAYSLQWATPAHEVILIDSHPGVVDLWHRLQRSTHAEIAAIRCPPIGEVTTEPLVALTAPGESALGSLLGRPRVVTMLAARDWPSVQAAILEHLELIRHWDVRLGDYRDAPNDTPATYFVDPPYQGEPGRSYAQDPLDYDDLGRWCQTRPGQVIACDQHPARWLPFRPFARQVTAATHGESYDQVRTELIWTSHQHDAPLTLFGETLIGE